MASIYYYSYYCLIDVNIKKYLDNFIIKLLHKINDNQFKNLKKFFNNNYEKEISEKMNDILKKEVKINEFFYDNDLYSNIEKYLPNYSVEEKLKIVNLIDYLIYEILENKPNNFFEFYEYIKNDNGLNSLNIV